MDDIFQQAKRSLSPPSPSTLRRLAAKLRRALLPVEPKEAARSMDAMADAWEADQRVAVVSDPGSVEEMQREVDRLKEDLAHVVRMARDLARGGPDGAEKDAVMEHLDALEGK
jgi:hypothetical protein